MSVPQRPLQFVLTLSCPSAAGQVAAVVGLLDRHRCYVDELTVFDDDLSERFFVRCVFHATGDVDSLRIDALRREFEPIATRFRMQWAIHDVAARPKVLIMVSKLEHCLADLLFRWKMGELKMDIVGIVSNHSDLEPLAAQHGLPFRHFPITADTKAQQEAQWLDVLETSGAELVILARYMQVLSPETSATLANRAINIHHSFLPGFKGAKPYHQAHARGVKLIGATAHFVTDDLDEGPIIEQVVERVDHSYRPEQLLAVGRDVECITLARAVKAFIERRVFLNGDRTVVFQ
ncbi:MULTISPECIES: formyltetrahydrofolate deformylase [Burkholderia]|uniref:formyltetrahydrofolate deformylase n=1 Tax=Burkholderia TaxID=32008 RepID=UPI000751FCCC|nr:MULTISPECIES: formyltetrahydrofolate deformylase [Burkholderia]AOJ72029.1 formyltetrahydrofolate deformylase [Burkholderia savannae]AOK50492.1 formyltetrahydrofolate deformylase [Burkholderia sp. MSMB617WGS]KVG49738.1 formyltetrahydrofolate deformylase [Burkholderia sp. MSMB0265]KVG82882.1 formyltetrahydrofolate deformylase [Burkholderia sp. MSMB2040]KVG93525.1 formyltetrahydrofolate deformylase [Burkholderia sp. MSMB2041]